MEATERLIEEMASVVAREADPEAIILFGSYATGSAGPDSDVDILVYSREEVDRWRDSRNHVIGRALREGVVLYGKL
ncbi:MAG: nucleotidyltransferase domain-containing protein [Firmicutes bacterium]|jgi:predicted nucleotidyltransferase|nr:nucleotidyltransferase domain-containing protein [Bacillota bacterium]MDD4336823.1 nucleotidyltransferase domain-containing protein [Bacillota bacterium]MDD4791443.1 nucleotidyltransferase domain-containing protein [Bacillota bacterium]